MKRLLSIIYLLLSIAASSQDKTIVKHGDTMFLVTHTYTTVADSQLRYNYTYHFLNDNIVYDTTAYMFYFNRITATSKDSVQINKFAIQPPLQSGVNVKTINNQPIVGSGDLPISASGITRVFLSGDVVNNNAVANTIADVTGLSFPVNANVTYRFKFFIVYSSAATTTGSRWCINGPANTFMNYYSNYTLTATSITANQGLTAYNLPAASSASSLTSGNIAVIEGVIRPSASGSVIARFASEITLSAITAIGSGRSYVEYEVIN